MKNLLTLLLLVISLLASGQSNSQSLEVEIKYWKSIAESNDTVAYRDYLQRYGENGLYKDEAKTRIALLKTSGRQTQLINTECCFYSQYGPKSVEYVVRFDAERSQIWLQSINYDIARSNLAMSRDFYENQATIAMSRGLYVKMKTSPIIGKITDNNMGTLSGATVVATHTPSGVQYYTVADENGNYCLVNIRPGGPYKIEYRMNGFRSVVKKGITATLNETKIINAMLNKESTGLCQIVVADETIRDTKNAWTTDEEYQYNPMKSTSARDAYFKRDTHIRIKNGDQQDKPSVISSNRWDGSASSGGNYAGNDGNHNRNETKYDYETIHGYRYVAFSKDKSSFIMWFEEDNNLDGVIREKKEYYKVPKEELLPKTVNYDFLNE